MDRNDNIVVRVIREVVGPLELPSNSLRFGQRSNRAETTIKNITRVVGGKNNFVAVETPKIFGAIHTDKEDVEGARRYQKERKDE